MEVTQRSVEDVSTLRADSKQRGNTLNSDSAIALKMSTIHSRVEGSHSFTKALWENSSDS